MAGEYKVVSESYRDKIRDMSEQELRIETMRQIIAAAKKAIKNEMGFMPEETKIESETYLCSEIETRLVDMLSMVVSSVESMGKMSIEGKRTREEFDVLAEMLDEKELKVIKEEVKKMFAKRESELGQALDEVTNTFADKNPKKSAKHNQLSLNMMAKVFSGIELEYLDATRGAAAVDYTSGVSLGKAIEEIQKMASANFREACRSNNPSFVSYSGPHDKLLPAGELRMTVARALSEKVDKKYRQYESSMREYEKASQAVKRLSDLRNVLKSENASDLDVTEVLKIIDKLEDKYRRLEDKHRSTFVEIGKITGETEFGSIQFNGESIPVADDAVYRTPKEDLAEYEMMLKDPHRSQWDPQTLTRFNELSQSINPNDRRRIQFDNKIIEKEVATQEKEGNALVDSRKKEIVAEFVESGIAAEFLDSNHAVKEETRKEFEKTVADFYRQKYGMDIVPGKIRALTEAIASGVFNAHAEQAKQPVSRSAESSDPNNRVIAETVRVVELYTKIGGGQSFAVWAKENGFMNTIDLIYAEDMLYRRQEAAKEEQLKRARERAAEGQTATMGTGREFDNDGMDL